MIVEERVGNEFHVGQIGEKLKEWVTQFRYKDFIAWIAQQPEDIGISFAGAGSQNQAIGIQFENLVRLSIVAANGLARRKQAARLRLVAHRIGIRQRR